MGRGKQTNKLYITHSEWSNEFGGMSFGGVVKKRQTEIFRRLPFFCCALSLQPFGHPVCTKEGVVFDLLNIVPYLKKHGKNPVTGEPLEAKSLIKLNFHKNTKDEYHCPVTFRVFNDHTHIVAVRQTGNVYAYEAVERLNVKAKYWQDLLTDEPFTRKDLITIQDPHDISNRNLEKFWHLKTEGKGNVDEALEEEKKDPLKNINAKGTTKRALAEITESKAKKAATAEPSQLNPSAPKPALPYNAAHFSTGAAAASFTSTAATPVTSNTRALIDEEEFMFKHIKKKGYVRLVTNLGNVNLELFCDEVPRTCYNFIQLAKSGYYNNVSFHRSIKNFMIQGGDPTGTGKGGESYWKKDFPDEIKQGLSHSARGVLSMANRGKETNSSQFFITYRPCKHLDGKHSIFGKVAGGMPTLDKMESIQTDDDDRPITDITITDVQVFLDPYEEYRQRLDRKLKYQQEEADSRNKPRELTRDEKETWFGTKLVTDKVSNEQKTGGVGKYLADAMKSKSATPLEKDVEAVPQKKKTIAKGGFDDFGGW